MMHNYTPHSITVFSSDGKVLKTFNPVGFARAEQKSVIVDEIQIGDKTVPVKKMFFGSVEGLPETAEEYDKFIVSSIAAQAAMETNHPLKNQLLVVADPVRNEDGQIVGCRSFSTFRDENDLGEIMSLADKFAHDEFGNIDW